MLIRHRRVFRDHLPPLRERERDDVILKLMKGVCVVAVALLALWLIWRL